MDAKEASELKVGQRVTLDNDWFGAGAIRFHNHVGTRVRVAWDRGIDQWIDYKDMQKIEKVYINENEKEAVEFIENWELHPNGFLYKLRKLNLTAMQVSGVLEAMDTTCHGCWDTDTSGGISSWCHCENDE